MKEPKEFPISRFARQIDEIPQVNKRNVRFVHDVKTFNPYTSVVGISATKLAELFDRGSQ